MLKTNIITVKQKIIFGFACFIALCVMMATLHVKDIVRYGSYAGTVAPVRYRDVAEKAVSDLHNHIDKQMVKVFGKAMGDTVAVNRGRDESDETSEDDPSLLERLSDALLIWRVYATLPNSI